MRRVTLLLVPLTLLVPTACRHGAGADPRDALLAAPAAMAAAGTAHLHVDLEVDGSAGHLTGEGLADLRHGRTAMTLRTGGGTAQVRRIGSVTYLRADALARVVPGLPDDAWLALRGDGGGELGLTGAGLATTVPSNALALLGYLRQDPAPVHDEGRARVRGVDTTRYRLRTDTGNQRVVLLVWLDEAGRVRRLELDVPIGSKERARITTDYSDFGTTAHVSPPRRDQIVEVPPR